jgi:hypothetical protein
VCYDIPVNPRKPRNLCLLTLLAPLSFGCESGEVHSNSYTGLTPTPTRVEKTRGEQMRVKQKKKDDGFLGLFGKDDKKSGSSQPKGLTIANPNGGTTILPRNYTGQTTFVHRGGQKYKLGYEKGTLISIEPEAGPAPHAPPPPQPEESPTPAARRESEERNAPADRNALID